MENWNRRSVLATGAIIAVGTGVATAKPKRTDDLPTVAESDGWSSVGGGPGNARRADANALETPDTVAWRNEGGGEPAVVDGTVYLAGDEIRALDAADGSLEWETEIDGQSQNVTVADDTVYVGGEGLVALEAATGSEEWSTSVGDGSVSAPLVAFGTAYVLSEGSLYAFDATDGSLRWERESVDVDDYDGGPMAFQARQSQVVATDDSVWVALEGAGQDGLAELEPATGETRWSGPVEAGAGDLAAADGTLLVQNDSLESVYTFDAERRETEEKLTDAYVLSIDDGVAVTQGRYDLQAVSLDDSGRTTGWTHSGSYTYGLPVIVGDTVVVTHSSPDPGADDDAVLGLDLEDGSESWAYEFDDGERWTDGADAGFLAVEDGTVYAQRGQELVAIRPTGWEEGGDEEKSDETDDGSDDEEYEPGEDDGNDSEEDEGVGNESDSNQSDGDENGGLGNGDDGTDDGNGGDASNETSGDDGDDTDGMPGFTAGAGIAGGALGLEWLRRRAGTETDLED
ncbi:PQQ-binding-like beta-propeller repeat protein [Natronococcus sp. A-GB7]|uniref:outer membrane protein assembly factor BamB family protein n=1 Tax=Natronococcus sp. A-GB7 TaxID=3037649 RepID=UPI0024204CA5|nr:PQQ-binding-like beta-propeller repeat protein [Natronococcus sp. A-GB7]MDG5821195.1 PQQ-binding-like beta-propeller repeat protein [Natronococcus sp. A-GB7]